MRIIPLAHQAISKLALIGLLLSPFVFTPSYAAELVGKPVPVGSQAASTSHASTSGTGQVTPVAESPEPPAVVETSSPQEELHQAVEDMRNNFHDDMGSSVNMNPDLWLPIIIVSILFGGPVLLIIILAFFHYRTKVRRQQNINANIDKLLAAGRDIPVELLLGEEASAVKRNVSGQVTVYRGGDDNLQKGMRNLGLGIGWLVFLTIAFGIKIGAFGFIFIGLGLSQVIIWKLSTQSTNSTADNSEIQEQ